MSRRLKILIGAGIVLGLAILIPVVRHYQLRFAVEKYVSELKAKGEPMELAQVIPPPVPPDRNGAPLITNALAQIYLEHTYTNSIIFNNAPYDMNRAIPGKEMIGWRQPVIHDPDGNWPTNTWEDLGTQLAERQNDLNDFRKLIENPIIDFNYDYSDPKRYLPALAPRLSQIKMAVQWLEASEYNNLHQDKIAEAWTDVRAMLALVEGQTKERFEISQLIRFALTQMIANATWEILQTTNVADEKLAQLQSDWQSFEFIVPLKNAFLFERVSELQLVDFIRKSPTNLDAQVAWTESFRQSESGADVFEDTKDFLQKVKSKVSTAWNKLQWLWFWSYTDEVRGVQMWRVVADATLMMRTNHSWQSVQSYLNTNFTQIGFNSVKNNPYAMTSQYAHNQLSAINHLARAETARNVVITAIALKRYELQHHQLPDTLDKLVPDFLESVPTDYMDGQPLRYRRNADGSFLLYSVGENGKDDGGDPTLEKGAESSSFNWQNPHALDWVWPQPATAEEIQKYYAQQKDSR